VIWHQGWWDNSDFKVGIVIWNDQNLQLLSQAMSISCKQLSMTFQQRLQNLYSPCMFNIQNNITKTSRTVPEKFHFHENILTCFAKPIQSTLCWNITETKNLADFLSFILKKPRWNKFPLFLDLVHEVKCTSPLRQVQRDFKSVFHLSVCDL